MTKPMTHRPRIPFPGTAGLAPALVILLILAALAVACWLLIPSWAARNLERARQRIDATLAADTDPETTRPPLGETPDPAAEAEAGRWLADGCRALSVAPEESSRLADLILRLPDDWTLSERDFVTALVRREAEPLAMIERAGAAGATPFAPEELLSPTRRGDPDGPDELLELAGPLLRGTRLLLARAGLALEAAPEEAGRSLVALAGSARALQTDPRPSVQDLGTAIEVLFLRGVHWAVADPSVPPEVFVDLRAALPEPSSTARIRTVVARLADTDGRAGVTGWRRLVPGGSDFETARRLDALGRVLTASREPGRLLELSVPGRPVADILGGDEVLPPLLRMQALDASEELARVALELRSLDPGDRTTAPPSPRELARRLEGLPRDPFAGGRVEADEDAGGRPVIADPDAERAWRDRWGAPPDGAAPPPFSWRLPSERR